MSSTTQTLRQPVVVVLGHVDAGKCVSGDTLIQLADGTIAEAEQVFERFRTGEPVEKSDGVVYEAKGLQLLSVQENGIISPSSASHVWRLHADRLIEVRTKAGFTIRTTPEHKFLVFEPSTEVRYVEAERLKLGDFILLPSRIKVFQTGLVTIKARIVSLLSDDFLLRVNPKLNAQVRATAKGRVRSLGTHIGDKNLEFHIRKGYYRASVFRRIAAEFDLPLGRAYDSITAMKFASRKQRATHKSPWVGLPKTKKQFEALLYLVGLLYGDGLAEKAHLANVSNDIINEFRRCVFITFGVGANQAWRRTCYIVSHKGGKSLARFLTEVFDYPTTDKTLILRVPEIVSAMPDRLVAKFLRGFFDAEGFVTEGRNIGVGCESRALMKQLPMLLQRFGCLAYFAKKTRRSELVISGRRNVSAFVDSIGFHDRRKMEAARRRLSSSETNRVFELTPIPGEFVRQVRMNNRVIFDRHFQLASYEPYERLSANFLSQMFQFVPSYKNPALQQTLTNYSMVRVTGLQSLEGDHTVFDFTVSETHNFLANCLIIHNTSLLDKIRGTAVQAREAGGITQEIGASFFPIETLQTITGNLLDRAGGELKIPGLLVIDTPGHEIFSNLRVRGGSAADIAILVVDVLKGLENQTIESLEILKQRHVPFLVALNKVDMIKGWKKGSEGLLSEVLKQLTPEWNDEFEERLYNVVASLSRLGFESDAYYRVKDFRKQVSIVPVSARYGTGIPELLAVLIGLAQQFLKGKLSVIEEAERGRGIILELQGEEGVGQTANVILTEGKFLVGDNIVLVKREGAVKSKVKALFMPKPLDEMRDPRDKFTPVQSVYAAAGVKLVSTDLEGVIPGTPVITFEDESEFASLKKEVEKDLQNVVVKRDTMGVIVKAGSIGGLEALLQMLKERGIPVRLADIGDISKNDMVEAEVVKDHDPYLAAILGFDVKLLPDAKEMKNGQVFISSVIYEVIDKYAEWAAKAREENERVGLASLTTPAKLKALPGAFFRRNDPAVFGVEVLAGKMHPHARLMNAEGKELGKVEQIQDKGKNLESARMGDKVAISVSGPTLGRQIRENDILYTLPRSHDVRLLRGKYLNALSEDDLQALEEIVRIRSTADPMYGF